MTDPTAPSEPCRRPLPDRLFLAAIGVHVLVRLVLVGPVGARVREQDARALWQLLELGQLERDPVGSVLRLHTQPPLFNLSVGALLAASPISTETTLTLAAVTLSTLLVAGVWVVVRTMSGPAAATVAALVVSLLPTTLAMEFFPSYELGVATLLVWLVAAVQRWAARPSTAALLAVSGVATAVMLTRALFHPVWVVVLVGALGLMGPGGRVERLRRVGAALAVPLVLLMPLMVRNVAVFETTSLSSWFGMNLQRVAVNPLTPEQHRSLLDSGALSQVSSRREFGLLEEYRAVGVECAATSTHPTLAEETKPGLPVPTVNLNHECYLPIYRQAMSDGITAIRAHPDAYLRGVGAASGRRFASTSPSPRRCPCWATARAARSTELAAPSWWWTTSASTNPTGGFPSSTPPCSRPASRGRCSRPTPCPSPSALPSPWAGR